MPSIWFYSFKDIDWSKALGVARSMADKARDLWTRASERTGSGASGSPRLQPPASDAERASALEVRVHDLEQKLKQLDEEVVSSFDVVRALTEQHSQLASATDVLITRTKVLLRVCVLLGIAVVALLALFVSR
jgi:hypothetical protein